MDFKPEFNGYITRHAEKWLPTALAEARIVAIVGPRHSGKTTLARRIAKAQDRPFVSLDDKSSRELALGDQGGFIRQHRFAAIDEIQRVPDLTLALKRAVDQDERPGRYLITGSVDFFKTVISPDSLAGRLSLIELLPFSQAEIYRAPTPAFLHRAFAGDFPAHQEIGFCENLNAAVVAGGYPAALIRSSEAARRRWLRDYARDVVRRDPPTAGKLRNSSALAQLLEYAAAAAGGLVTLSTLASRLQVNHNTVLSWLRLLEEMFLIKRVRAWHRSQIRRLVKAPKLHFVDSGLLAALRRVSEASLNKRRQELGVLLETFVLSELLKAITLAEDSLHLSHYRDRDGNEVDFVLENFAGTTVGLEVKAATDVYPGDFRGLRCLATAAGEQFACGIIIHDGSHIRQFDERLFAMPVAMLWQ